jgi:CubicO group peptidase (beta-lactamase class C family)
MTLPRSIRLIAFLLFVLVVFPTARAQEPPLAGFDDYVNKALRDWEVPGPAIAIVKNDQVVFAKGYGVRKLGDPVPVDERTLFAIGSSSKAFTAAAVAMLVDEGKLKWDDSVTKYLPGFELYDPYVTRELKVRDLLDEFIRERIFTPLAMSASNTSIIGFKNSDNVASPHAKLEDKVEVIPWRSIDNIAPAGAINSNVLDMAQWVRLQLNQGTYNDQRLFSSGVSKEIHTPQTIIRAGDPPYSLLYPEALDSLRHYLNSVASTNFP